MFDCVLKWVEGKEEKESEDTESMNTHNSIKKNVLIRENEGKKEQCEPARFYVYMYT